MRVFIFIFVEIFFLASCSKFSEEKKLALQGCIIGVGESEKIRFRCTEKNFKSIYDDCFCQNFQNIDSIQKFCGTIVSNYDEYCSNNSKDKTQYNICMASKLSEPKTEVLQGYENNCIKKQFPIAINLFNKFFNNSVNFSAGGTYCLIDPKNSNNSHLEYPIPIKIFQIIKTTEFDPGSIKFAVGQLIRHDNDFTINQLENKSFGFFGTPGERNESLQNFLYYLNNSNYHGRKYEIVNKTKCLDYTKEHFKIILDKLEMTKLVLKKQKIFKCGTEYEREDSRMLGFYVNGVELYENDLYGYIEIKENRDGAYFNDGNWDNANSRVEFYRDFEKVLGNSFDECIKIHRDKISKAKIDF